MTLTNLAGQVNASIPKVSYPVKLIDSIQFSRWCVFFSIIEYALANWLMRIEGRIEKAASKVAKREAAKAAAVLSGTPVVAPGEGVQVIVNEDDNQRERTSARHSDGSGSAASATLSESAADRATCSCWGLAVSSLPKTRNVKNIKKQLSVIDRCFINSTGHLCIRDQHLDVFSRFAYPVVCIVGLIVVILSA